MRILKLVLDKDKKRVNKDSWNESVELKEASMRQYQDANLRDLYDDEIVLDCESKLESSMIRIRLNKEGYGYKEWSTGSRGSHFHLKVQGLQALEERERILYRSKMIHDFGTDIAKKTGFIAIEGKRHFKTGNPKVLINEVTKVNKINLKILMVIKKRLEKSKALNTPYAGTNLKEKIQSKWNLTDVMRRYNFDLSKRPTDCMIGHVGSNDKCFNYQIDRGVWYCHNDECQCGGDMFELVMKIEDVGFSEALKIMNEW